MYVWELRSRTKAVVLELLLVWFLSEDGQSSTQAKQNKTDLRNMDILTS